MSKRFAAVVLVIAGIKGLFYLMDPMPQFYGGDSMSYLHTRIGVWIPPDRSFVYGLLIRIIEACSHSLTPLILLQVGLSFIACLLLYHCAKEALGLSFRLSLALTCLFAVDPLQLLYERQVMAETICGFSLAVVLTLSLSYLRQPRAWKCVLIPFWGVVATSFRVNSYPLAWLLCLGVPVLLLFRKFSIYPRQNGMAASESLSGRHLAGHWVTSVACFLIFLSLYTHWYGDLTQRKPAVTYTEGLFMLSGLWDIVIPADAPDPKLGEIIADKREFLPGQNRVLERNVQRYGEDGLIARWERIEIQGPQSLHDDIARKTAWNAIRRAPAQVLHSTVSNYCEYFSDIETHILDLYERFDEVPEPDRRLLQQRFQLAVTKDWKSRVTLTKRHLILFRWWCYVLLLSPFWGTVAASLSWNTGRFRCVVLLTCAAFLLFLPGCIFIVTNVRLLHPLSFGAFLMLGGFAGILGGRLRAESKAA